MPLVGLASAMSHDDDPSADLMSVRELMRLESVQAIEQATASAAGHSKAVAAWPEPDRGAQQTDLRLVAVYGFGSRLLAQVDIGGEHYLFEQGRARPTGRHSKNTDYILESISKACIRLRREETTHDLCLHPDFRASQ